MTWTKKANSFPEYIEQAQTWVRGVFREFRADGCKAKFAIQQTALALGTSERKTRSLLRSEPVAVTDIELRRLADRRREYLNNRSRELIARAEAVLEESRQMEMRF